MRYLALLTTSLLSLTTTACTTDPHDPFADLPPYDQQTGGGKQDDASCTDESYRTFLAGYATLTSQLPAPANDATLAQAAVAADANPCKYGNDASFRLWSHALGQHLQPVFDRLAAAATDPTLTRETLEALTTLTDDERDAARYHALVRPPSTGLVGLAQWHEVYMLTLRAASRFITRPDGTVIQAGYELTAAEGELLATVESSRPVMNEAGGYAAWYGRFISARLERLWIHVTAQQPIPNPFELAYLARQSRSAPHTRFEADAEVYQTQALEKVHELFQRSALSRQPTESQLEFTEVISAFRPDAGGTRPYVIWAEEFASNVRLLYPRDMYPAEERLVRILIDSKPCASGPEADAAYATLQREIRYHGLATLAAPVACP